MSEILVVWKRHILDKVSKFYQVQAKGKIREGGNAQLVVQT